jgi:hypothetical protein
MNPSNLQSGLTPDEPGSVKTKVVPVFYFYCNSVANKFKLIISIKTKMIYLEPIKFKSNLTKSFKTWSIKSGQV